jgi:hypothetical protein
MTTSLRGRELKNRGTFSVARHYQAAERNCDWEHKSLCNSDL